MEEEPSVVPLEDVELELDEDPKPVVLLLPPEVRVPTSVAGSDPVEVEDSASTT